MVVSRGCERREELGKVQEGGTGIREPKPTLSAQNAERMGHGDLGDWAGGLVQAGCGLGDETNGEVLVVVDVEIAGGVGGYAQGIGESRVHGGSAVAGVAEDAVTVC